MPTKSCILHHSTEASNKILTTFWHQGNRLKSEAQFPTNTDSNLLLTYSSNLWKALSCYRRNTCKEPYSLTGFAACTLFQTCTKTRTHKKVQVFLVIYKMLKPVFTTRWTNLVSTNKAFALSMPSLVLSLYSFLLRRKLISLVQKKTLQFKKFFLYILFFLTLKLPHQHSPRKVWPYTTFFKEN